MLACVALQTAADAGARRRAQNHTHRGHGPLPGLHCKCTVKCTCVCHFPFNTGGLQELPLVPGWLLVECSGGQVHTGEPSLRQQQVLAEDELQTRVDAAVGLRGGVMRWLGELPHTAARSSSSSSSGSGGGSLPHTLNALPALGVFLSASPLPPLPNRSAKPSTASRAPPTLTALRNATPAKVCPRMPCLCSSFCAACGCKQTLLSSKQWRLRHGAAESPLCQCCLPHVQSICCALPLQTASSLLTATAATPSVQRPNLEGHAHLPRDDLS